MDWLPVETITTSNSYAFTPIVAGALFKLRHITQSPKIDSLKIVIRQAFENDGVVALFDYKLIKCKAEQEIILFGLPQGLTNRKLAIKRVDNYLNEAWNIEIESLEIVEDGVNLPITISDVSDLQQRLDAIQAELTLKALDLDLDTHTANTNNPHGVTALQIAAEPLGIAKASVVTHEGTTNHPIASATNKGMMQATDKEKLDTIASGATANANDSFLLNRTNHDGIQPVNTIEGLADYLENLVTIFSNQEVGGSKVFKNATLFESAIYTYLFVNAVGYYYRETPANLELKRDVSGVYNDYVELGNFNISSGGVALRVSLIVSDPGFSLAKMYEIVTSYASSDSGWLRVIPIKSSLFSVVSDCELDVRIAQSSTSIRLRRSGDNGVTGVARVRLEFLGDSTTVFTETSVTGNDPSVTGSY